jgi:hypothetical protein
MLSRTLTTVSYTFALVTIIISGVIAANIGAKYLYVHSLRDSPLLTSSGWKAHGIWIGVVSLIWTVAFLISQLVPFFNQLLTIVSSLFSVWLTYGSAGIIWFWDESPWLRNFARDENERRMNTKAKWFKACIAVLSVSYHSRRILLIILTFPLMCHRLSFPSLLRHWGYTAPSRVSSTDTTAANTAIPLLVRTSMSYDDSGGIRSSKCD